MLNAWKICSHSDARTLRLAWHWQTDVVKIIPCLWHWNGELMMLICFIVIFQQLHFRSSQVSEEFPNVQNDGRIGNVRCNATPRNFRSVPTKRGFKLSLSCAFQMRLKLIQESELVRRTSYRPSSVRSIKQGAVCVRNRIHNKKRHLSLINVRVLTRLVPRI